jgi:hypothetical protein
MDDAQTPVKFDASMLLVRLAREIAIDHFPLEAILERYQVSPEQWETIRKMPRFTALLEIETADWQGSLNTGERTKLKAAAMIEDFLPEAHSRMHDARETLPAKTELAKLIAKIAGMGERTDINGVNSSEKFSVTINLGADQQLQFAKQVTPKVIEVETLKGE